MNREGSRGEAGEPIGQLLAMVCRLHHARAHELFEKLGLYRGQPQLLRRLWEKEGRTQAELARALHVRPATASRMLERMEKAGLVVRRKDSANRRVTRVYLGVSGRAVRQQVTRAVGRLEREAIAGLSPRDRRTLASLLGRIRENLLARKEQAS